MNKLAAFVVLGLLAGCAKSPQAPIYLTAAPDSSFTIDQFLAVALEYQGQRALVGIDTYGPTEKEFSCQKSGQAAVSQAGNMLPNGHTLVTTCLHIAFGGPLPKGAALQVPVTGTPFEYVTLGVEYAKSGDFVGAQALHTSPDAKTCMHEARDVIQSNYKSGNVAPGNTLLLYCMPIPVLEHNSTDEGGIV